MRLLSVRRTTAVVPPRLRPDNSFKYVSNRHGNKDTDSTLFLRRREDNDAVETEPRFC